MTRQESTVSKALEDLVGGRFNKETLETELSRIFGVKTEVADITKDDDESADFNLLTEFDMANGVYGFADIYYLPMRREGFDGSIWYITGIACEFNA